MSRRVQTHIISQYDYVIQTVSFSQVERIAVTAMSGLMGELTKYDKADGGGGDLESLQDVFFKADSENLRKPQVGTAHE